jgi:maleylacetate reductase
MRFEHEAAPARVVFGPGALRGLPEEVDRLGARKLHLIVSPRLHTTVRDLLGDRVVIETVGAAQHVPWELVAERARDQKAHAVDGYIAVGGGSTIGLAKALALQHTAPIVAVPTTYSGSEMSPIWGITRDGVKSTGRNPDVAPRLVIYDADLVASLDSKTAVSSVVNAMAHAVEALYAPARSPMLLWTATEAVRVLGSALAAFTDGDDGAHTDALIGSWLAGTSLAGAPMGLHHKLCHVLGGRHDLPHAPLHTVLLPFVMRWHQRAAPTAMAAIAQALPPRRSGVDAAARLQEMVYAADGPGSLWDIGYDGRSIRAVVRDVVASNLPTPAHLDEDGLSALLEAATVGDLRSAPVADPRACHHTDGVGAAIGR